MMKREGKATSLSMKKTLLESSDGRQCMTLLQGAKWP